MDKLIILFFFSKYQICTRRISFSPFIKKKTKCSLSLSAGCSARLFAATAAHLSLPTRSGPIFIGILNMNYLKYLNGQILNVIFRMGGEIFFFLILRRIGIIREGKKLAIDSQIQSWENHRRLVSTTINHNLHLTVSRVSCMSASFFTCKNCRPQAPQ